jgi:MFS family permease
VGFAVGPPLGGFLGSGEGGVPSLHWPALASAGLSMLALLGTAFLLRESLAPEMRKPLRPRGAAATPAAVADAPRRSPFAALAARPVLAGLILATLVVAVGGGSMQSVFQFWGRDLFQFTLRDIGLQFMVFALLSAVGQAGLIGPLARRFGEKPIAIASIIGVTVGLLTFAVATQVWMVWVGIAIFGLANGLFLPAVTSLVSFEADPRNRGAVMGLFNAASSAGRIVGPAVSGPVYFNVGVAAPFVGSAVLTAIGALLLSRAHAPPAKAVASEEAPPAAPPPGDATR